MGRPRLEQPNYRLKPDPDSGVYYVHWSEDRRTKRVSTGCSVEADAKVWKAQFVAGRSAVVAPEVITVGQILDHYLEERKGNVEAYATLEHACKPLRRAYGDLAPEHISRPLARSYIKQRRAAGRSDGTIRREVVTLRAALTLAVKDNWISAAPFVEAPPNPPPREKWLTKKEAQRLLAACPSRHLKLYVLISLHTAARRGAVLSLTWDRVDFERRLISFGLPGRTHSKKRRAVVPINDTLFAALKEAQKIAVTDYVIEYGEKQVGNVKMAFNRAVKRAGLDITPHDLRRTAATWMVQEGVPLAEVARYLSDTEKMVERVYGKHAPSFLKRASKALE